MSTNTEAAENSIAPDVAALPLTFGVDGAGAAHHHDDWNDRVAVIEPDGSVHHHDLEGRPLAAWVAYVRSERGWTDEWHDEWLTGAEHDRRIVAARAAARTEAER